VPRSQKHFPTSLKIGEHRYRVTVQHRVLRRAAMGEIHYAARHIVVATHSALTGRPYSRWEVHDTFWHEVTHGILYEMQHRLHADERFVRRFATLLTRAIESARFG
jgi:hypothetical protein